MRHTTRVRIGILLALLLAEISLVVALNTLGWLGTGSAIRWWSCLLLAALPIAIAIGFLVAQRFRFGLRYMLVAMSLIAVFLYATVLPLRNAIDARRGSQSLWKTSAKLRPESYLNSIYKQIGYDPRPQDRVEISAGRTIPVWLRPLAGDVLKVSPDADIKSIGLTSDVEVSAFCENVDRFLNLEHLDVYNVSAAALEELSWATSGKERITDLTVNAGLPAEFLNSMKNVRTLDLTTDLNPAPRALSASLVREIAEMPNLRVLFIVLHPITDADAAILAESKTLRYILLRKTAVTEAGAKALSEAMPNCEIHRD